eukprot:2523505-Karenia_brevis.AAC.1
MIAQVRSYQNSPLPHASLGLQPRQACEQDRPGSGTRPTWDVGRARALCAALHPTLCSALASTRQPHFQMVR